MVASYFQITGSITVGFFQQFSNSTLSIKVFDLNGVAIQATNIGLSGTLILDLSGVDVVDGMVINLLVGNVTGNWSAVQIATDVSSDCTQYQRNLFAFV